MMKNLEDVKQLLKDLASGSSLSRTVSDQCREAGLVLSTIIPGVPVGAPIAPSNWQYDTATVSGNLTDVAAWANTYPATNNVSELEIISMRLVGAGQKVLFRTK